MRRFLKLLVAVTATAMVLGGTAATSVHAAPGATSTTGEERSYLLTFEEGVDADEVLLALAEVFPIVVTHRFGTVIQSAVVRTTAAPEELAMFEGVATVDLDRTIELPPFEPDPEEPGEDPEVPDPEDPDPDPELPDEEPPTVPEPPDVELPEPPPLPEPGDESDLPDVNGVPWGLDRTDQRELPLSGSYSPPARGQGVTVYVVDSGVSPHAQFGDRLAPGFNALDNGSDASDCNGHGTHVAGTAAGSEVGIASAARVVPVRIFGCGGGTSEFTIVNGLDWIAANHPRGTPGVVNFSVGPEGNVVIPAAMERAVAAVVDAGLTFVGSAGNDGISACGNSVGAQQPGVLVVGASTHQDQRPQWSNHGPCVDIFAPGEEVRSASIESSDAQVAADGTSMAAPHVAGAAAVILEMTPSLTPADVVGTLLDEAVDGAVAGAGPGSPNLLLHLDPNRTGRPPTPAAAPVDAPAGSGTTSGPGPQVANAFVAAATDSALAVTGGDPRALLALGSMLTVLGGAILLGRRRRDAHMVTVLPVAQVRPAPLAGFEWRPPTQR